MVEVQKQFGALLILHQHKYLKSQLKDYLGGKHHNYKYNYPLVEVRDQDTPANAILCSAESDFYILLFHQSAIFVSSKAE